MAREIELWRVVADDAALLTRAAAVNPSDVSEIATLRKHYPAEVVSAALSMTEARAKAISKFGERGKTLITDASGVEQASSAQVAAYKAKRIREQLGDGTAIADLCCGIGGDSMAFVDAGLDVLAVDHDPLRAWMVKRNCGGSIKSVCADVGALALDGMPIHLDPARRNESTRRRIWRLDDIQPGREVIGSLIEQSPSAAIKLSPGINIDELPWPGEVEFISDGGRLVQAMLWAGGFAQTPRRATLIDEHGSHSLSGEPAAPFYRAAQRYLYTFDAAVERADLIGPLSEQLDAPSIHPKLGLLTSDQIIDSPWTTGFELIERLPWRPKRVSQWLKANDGGLVEVKTRGKACDPDQEQRVLRNDGATTYTVFVLRFDTKVQALITRRL